jgi:hypothetical protein
VGLSRCHRWSCWGAVSAVAAGCGSPPRSAFPALDDDVADAAEAPDTSLDSSVDASLLDTESGVGSDGPRLEFAVDATPNEASTSDCSNDATAFVFVLSSANDLYSFAPDKKVFTKIGALGCATTSAPNSMAVDRQAVAWVNYLDGTLRPVSTKDAGCQGQPITLPAAWSPVGMGFSSASAGSTSETLYLAGARAAATSGFGRVDFGAGSVVPIGQFTAPLMGQDAELTGTGDGRLFGFFAASPVQIAEIDKTSGAVLSSTPLTQIGTPSDFAFSFWGGRFYLYTYPNETGTSTNVSEYDPGTGAVDTSYMTDIGFLIVGAGVSTCAPTAPPTAR